MTVVLEVPPQAPIGPPAPIAIVVHNLLATRLVAVPLVLEVRPVLGESNVLRRELVVDLEPGASHTLTLSFDTATLGPGIYEVALLGNPDQLGGSDPTGDGSGQPGHSERRLAVARTILLDVTAPVLELLAPADGQLLPVPVAVRTRALDAHSALARVEVTLDSGGWASVSPSGSRDEYSAALGDLTDGSHTVAVRAVDTAGNETRTSVAVAIDGTPPEITVSGVHDGQRASTRVSPVVTVSDPHLDHSTTLLDGAMFASGSVVTTAGRHRLEVAAVDRAGNESALAVAFEILPPGAPRVVAELRVELEIDEGGTGAGPGDRLRWELLLRNDGEGDGREMLVSLPLPPHTDWIDGPRLDGLPVDDGERQVALAILEPGATRLVEWWVEIDGALPSTVREIAGQAMVSGVEMTTVRSDDPELPGASDPTVLGVEPLASIPALGYTSLAALILLLMAAALHRMRGGQ